MGVLPVNYGHLRVALCIMSPCSAERTNRGTFPRPRWGDMSPFVGGFERYIKVPNCSSAESHYHLILSAPFLRKKVFLHPAKSQRQQSKHHSTSIPSNEMSSESAPMQKKTYKGSCHCGLLTYSVSLPEDPTTWDLTKCNCSICLKGNIHCLSIWDPESISSFSLLTPSPSSPDFAANVGDYTFYKKTVHYYFCKMCGVKTHKRGKILDGTMDMLVINAVTLDDPEVDFSTEAMKVKGYWDGKYEKWHEGLKKVPVAPGTW
ncbi:hypothetical protein BDZ91DRAFT_750239 [Kalaharituber pfeilii]|nr:hypothetical protein BDZ91DRAFT_750239 [Kalaharituber pfeilii]